ncbi:MAG: hypothetical protein C0598_00845, partial [Marinilabiliales bacterium]
RKAPRFELLGRFGDIFKMGPLFNYNEFVRALETDLNYTSPLQLVLTAVKDGPQTINIRVEKGFDKSENDIISCIRKTFPTIDMVNEKEILIDLKVEKINEEDFEKVATTGKLKSIIDKRNIK